MNGIPAHETATVVISALVTRRAHRRDNFLRKALGAQRLIAARLREPKGVAELIVIGFEAQFVTKLTIFVLKFRGGLFQVSQFVRNLVDFLSQFLIF
ncbi:MAG TPA: hypothetical protein VGT24_04525 [Candidatus Acidoferrales bacterium]|nr:hypothetical protein [Candidatus Acidoferrales bacterium]